MKNKSQMKIQQMAFMLIAVTLFFVLVGMLVLVWKFSDLRETATALEEKEAMLLITKLANSPEFSCGRAFDYGGSACIDADKVMMLKENIGKYPGFWGVKNIEIRKIYPEGEEICSLGNYPNCNIIRVKGDEISGNYISNFVALCRKELYEGDVYDKCELAKLMVSYEEQ